MLQIDDVVVSFDVLREKFLCNPVSYTHLTLPTIA